MRNDRRDASRAAPARATMSRRELLALSAAAGVALAARRAPGAASPVVERDVNVLTPDGLCDAAFFHPATGRHPGVLLWHDSLGLRPAMRELGRRMAGEGYAVLVPNMFYRMAHAPVFPKTFDYANSAADRELYRRIVGPFLAPGAAERDAVAYVRFLDAQPQVDTDRKIGSQGYCLGGPYTLKSAAQLPDLVGAAASLHGGFLVTDKPDSPHLLAPNITARVYVAIASDDDAREPKVKDQLKEAFAAAHVPAEVEVYATARQGFCVPDSGAYDRTNADRAWSKLIALYQAAL